VRLQLLGVRMRRKHRRLVRDGPLAGQMLLAEFANARPEAFFIEIGANDGTQQDHLGPLILSTRWRGIMVEPQPDAFRRLVSNFGSVERVALENAAISDRDGKLPFYEVEPPKRAGSWELFGSYDLLGSLSREALLEHDWIDDVEHRIVRTEVDCLRLESLCEKHSVDRCDLLVVDTEGHDYEVLRQLGPSGLRPLVVGYEHALLRTREREACRGMLRDLGYELLEESFDTWCFDARVEDDLTRKWRRLRPSAPPVVLRDD
jgi:FkbM family methyltransferase